MPDDEVLSETDKYIDICLGNAQWQTADGRFIMEEDFNVAGEVWRVHKYDADPLPSNPHAHCVGGASRYIGRKLHLGTRELYDGPKPLGRYLGRKQFERLIELIRPKFPCIKLPLS